MADYYDQVEEQKKKRLEETESTKREREIETKVEQENNIKKIKTGECV
jgi:hypothetical protein